MRFAIGKPPSDDRQSGESPRAHTVHYNTTAAQAQGAGDASRKKPPPARGAAGDRAQPGRFGACSALGSAVGAVALCAALVAE